MLYRQTKPGTPLEPVSYVNASVTELFCEFRFFHASRLRLLISLDTDTNNLYHDLLHRYGFGMSS